MNYHQFESRKITTTNWPCISPALDPTDASLTSERSNAAGSCIICQGEQEIHLCSGFLSGGWRPAYKDVVVIKCSKGIPFNSWQKSITKNKILEILVQRSHLSLIM
jgi:hypothetical protein